MKKILIILLLFNLNFNQVASIEPEIFVQSTVNRASQILSESISKEEKMDARNIAHRRVKLGLLMGEIGRTNNLDVTDEEINQAVMKEAQKYPGQEKQVLDYFKNNKEASQNLAGPLFEEKVFDFICEMADLKEKKVSVAELYNDQDVDQKPNKHQKSRKSSTVKSQ